MQHEALSEAGALARAMPFLRDPDAARRQARPDLVGAAQGVFGHMQGPPAAVRIASPKTPTGSGDPIGADSTVR